jgi:glycosyltransferase involved in cell wall biosynthesis
VPSTYEGFGFPALEAMARRTAVVAADAGSLPEVCSDAALLSPPTGAGFSAALVRVLTDDGVREQLLARGTERARTFTWAASARAHAEIYRNALGRDQP